MGISRLIRWALAIELRSLREEAGLKPTPAARLYDQSSEAIRKWEKGETSPSSLALEGLCSRLDVDPSTKSYLLHLHEHRNTPDLSTSQIFEPRLLLRADQNYPVIRKYEPLFLPGVLQIEDYHFSELIRDPRISDERSQANWNLKQRRQKEIENRRDTRIEIIIGDTVLQMLNKFPCRQQQLDHLYTAAKRGWDIRVVRTPHPFMQSGFDIFLASKYQEEPHAPSFVYLEAPDMSEYIEKRSRVKSYNDLFDTVLNTSIPLGEYLC